MASRLDPLRWTSARTLHASPFEGVPGLHRLVHVQAMFDRHAAGKGADRAMNQRAWQAFCEQMGLVDAAMTRRLFLAADNDSTGAVEAHEFLRAVRLMADDWSAGGGEGSAAWDTARLQFAFDLIDEGGEGTVSSAQIKAFLKAFYAEARNVLVELMNQLEDILGMDIGVVSNRGATYKVRWSEEPSLQRVFASLEAKLAKEQWRMVDHALDYRAKGEAGLNFAGFRKWCTAPKDEVRLRVLDWLKVLGDLWLQRMALAVHKDDSADGPSRHHHGGACQHKHPGRTHPPHPRHPPSRSAYQVSRVPMFGFTFSLLTQQKLTAAFGRPATGAPAGGAAAAQSGSSARGGAKPGRYENALELNEAEFDQCLRKLFGPKHPPLRKRFFEVFERKVQKQHYGQATGIVGAFGFIEPREFMAGLQLLMVKDRDETLDMLFKMFDVQGRGFVGEAELYRLLNLCFLVAADAARSVQHTLELLLGRDKEVEREIRAAATRLRRHYTEVVTESVFKELAPDGPDKVKRLDLSELKEWSADNGGRLRDWLQCLRHHWLASIEKTVPGITEPAELLLPEGVLLNVLEAYDRDPSRKSAGPLRFYCLPGHLLDACTFYVDPVISDPHYQHLLEKMWGSTTRRTPPPPRPAPVGRGGAPAIPKPHCTFAPSKVKAIQDLFAKLSGADGVMTPAEWKRCLRAAGVFNERLSLRLFQLFDVSGDQEMNAKEFTWGLSAICSSDPHPGTKMTPKEVRDAFAYRFYDSDGSGYFEKEECRAFLLSWQDACADAVERAMTEFEKVYAVDRASLESHPSAKVEQRRIDGMGKEVETELIRFNDQLFEIFTGTYGTRMTYDHFKKLAKQAPIVVDCLTELGAQLSERLPSLAGMSFEEGPKPDSAATELSHVSMQKTFRACASTGVLDCDGFVRLLRTQRVTTNAKFGGMLFRVMDTANNGSLTEDEFIDAVVRTVMGTPEERLSAAFRFVDSRKDGFVSSKSLRTFLQSWFDVALDAVDHVATGLDEWLNGRRKIGGRSPDSDARTGGLEPVLFKLTNKQPKPREANLEIAVNLRKKSAAQVGLLVDRMVDDAMSYASQTNPSKGQHLYPREFSAWLEEKTRFIHWLAKIASPWMVTREQAELEGDMTKVGPSARRPVRKSGAAPIPARPIVDPYSAVIAPGDVGRTVGSIVYSAVTGEPDLGLVATEEEMSAGPGSKWWGRALTNRAHVEPPQQRPATHFDSITLEDVENVFGNDVAGRRSYDRAKFRAKLRQMGFTSNLVMDKLYTMFDINGDGLLDAEEASCGLSLLAVGKADERLRHVFRIFDVGKTDAIQKHDMRVLLRAFVRVGMEAISSVLDRLSELFGPAPTGGVQMKETEEYRTKILKRANDKLSRSTERMLEIAFHADVNQDHVLSWHEFQLWAAENPQFNTWLDQLGLCCLESVATVEDRGIRHAGAKRPLASTFRARRQHPRGSDFEKLRVYQVRGLVGTHTTFGKLGAERFAACLHALHVRSPYTVRRLFALFDRDGSGDVDLREFAPGFFLLCGGGLEEKLAEAFVLYDADGNGTLDGAEMSTLLGAFTTLAMDVVCCSLSTTTAVLQPDPAFDEAVLELSHARLQRYIRAKRADLARFCARDKGKYYFAEFYRWAEQDGDFLVWLESLRNLWLETIVQYEDPAASPQPHTLPSERPRPRSLFPNVPRLGNPGEQGVYTFPYEVKSRYTLRVARSVLSKRLEYNNPYGEALRLELTTDRPDLLTLTQPVYSIPPLGQARLALQFEPPAARRGREPPPTHAQLRLWVHNQSACAQPPALSARISFRSPGAIACAGRNEECIVFNIHYLTAFEVEAEEMRLREVSRAIAVS